MTNLTGYIFLILAIILGITSNGFLITSSPTLGKTEYYKKIGDPVISAPIITDGKLYILTKNSRILGFN